MKASVVIFAGGTGERVNNSVPKQFLKIQNKPIISHVIEKFHECPKIENIYIAILKGYENEMRDIVSQYRFTKVKSIINGGTTGMDTIYKLLLEMKAHESEDNIVLIHDGVRPIVTLETIDENIRMCSEKGNAITVEKSTETTLYANNENVSYLERDYIFFAKAPQTFILKDIINAHQIERKKENPYLNIIDNCSLVLSQNKKVNFVLGNRGNIKLTTKQDYFSLIGNMNALDYYNFFNNEKE